jgi:D-glycero-D-manno-heptose 1,7-bisphosphate phosphatase
MVNEYGGVIDAVFFCPHGPKDNCDCRKPKPGMLEQISQRLRVKLDGVPVIGDTLRDLQAAQAVGAQPVLVRTGKGTKTLYSGEVSEDIPVFCDLKQAANALLADTLLENI